MSMKYLGMQYVFTPILVLNKSEVSQKQLISTDRADLVCDAIDLVPALEAHAVEVALHGLLFIAASAGGLRAPPAMQQYFCSAGAAFFLSLITAVIMLLTALMVGTLCLRCKSLSGQDFL